nr:immunoglobulin light chain junction region [Macaca mulatta]
DYYCAIWQSNAVLF